MKKLILFMIFGYVSFVLFAQDLDKYRFADSSYVFNWQTEDSSWILRDIQLYEYDDLGKLILVKTIDSNTREKLSLVENKYNVNGYLQSATNYHWDNAWFPIGRSLFLYKDDSLYKEILVQKRINDEWITDRWQKNYYYDIYGKLIQFQKYYWRNESWTLPTTDYWYYNDKVQLIKRVAIYPSGNTDFRVLYNYDSTGLRLNMYAQYPSGSSWYNWWLREFQYDDCGNSISQVRYSGHETEWLPNTKTVFLSSFNRQLYPYKKVPVCHNGHTIWVSKNAVPAHLKHGDCLGECLEEKNPNSNRERESTSSAQKKSLTFEDIDAKLADSGIQIYPNPAQKQFTLNLGFNEQNFHTVEILDLSGRVVRKVMVSDDPELVIIRGDLKKGMYFIRLAGDEVVMEKIVFE